MNGESVVGNDLITIYPWWSPLLLLFNIHEFVILPHYFKDTVSVLILVGVRSYLE